MAYRLGGGRSIHLSYEGGAGAIRGRNPPRTESARGGHGTRRLERALKRTERDLVRARDLFELAALASD